TAVAAKDVEETWSTRVSDGGGNSARGFGGIGGGVAAQPRIVEGLAIGGALVHALPIDEIAIVRLAQRRDLLGLGAQVGGSRHHFCAGGLGGVRFVRRCQAAPANRGHGQRQRQHNRFIHVPPPD